MLLVPTRWDFNRVKRRSDLFHCRSEARAGERRPFALLGCSGCTEESQSLFAVQNGASALVLKVP